MQSGDGDPDPSGRGRNDEAEGGGEIVDMESLMGGDRKESRYL